MRTRLRLRLTEIDPVLRYYCSTASNPQPIAAPLQRALQRSDKLATVIIKSSRLVWTRSRSDSTQPYKTENAQNYKNLQNLVVHSLVEMGRIVDVFTPNAPTRLNCFVGSDFLVWTRLRCDSYQLKSFVEMGRIVNVFTPNATTQQNSLVESDLVVRTRLKAKTESYGLYWSVWLIQRSLLVFRRSYICLVTSTHWIQNFKDQH